MMTYLLALWRRIPAWMLVALVAAAASCAPAGAQVLPEPPPGEVWVTARQVLENAIAVRPVTRERLPGVTLAGAKVTFDDLRVAHVFSPVTGRITQVLAHPGQRVKKGDPLARITSPDVGSAYADVVKAQADLVAAEHDYNRQKELFDAHAASRKDLEVAEDNFRKARAEYHRAQQKTRLLRSGSINSVTQEYTLRAPIDGEVVARSNVNPGNEVQGQYAGGNAVELFTIGELDEVWVLADVFEVDLPRVAKGGDVSIKVIAYPDRVFTGKVDWISDTLDPASRTAKVRCSIPNRDRRLKPEMYATAAIAGPGRSMLAVPRDAVLRLGDRTVVFVEAGAAPGGQRKFQQRPVAVQEEEGEALVPVTHGLNPGDRVVTSGAMLLAGVI
jgi:cobalt-zinc-cadmium efflux system membrane fusion protein